MTRFIQENWIVIIFVVAMLAMHLGHRGGHGGGQHGGGQHGGAGGCGGGHAGHQDTSPAGEPRSQPDSRTAGNPTPQVSTPQDSTPQVSTPQDSTPQDSAQPREATAALPSPAHRHH